MKTKPSYITIEDLNVSGMMKNRHLSKAVARRIFKCDCGYIGNRNSNAATHLRDAKTYEVA